MPSASSPAAMMPQAEPRRPTTPAGRPRRRCARAPAPPRPAPPRSPRAATARRRDPRSARRRAPGARAACRHSGRRLREERRREVFGVRVGAGPRQPTVGSAISRRIAGSAAASWSRPGAAARPAAGRIAACPRSLRHAATCRARRPGGVELRPAQAIRILGGESLGDGALRPFEPAQRRLPPRPLGPGRRASAPRGPRPSRRARRRASRRRARCASRAARRCRGLPAGHAVHPLGAGPGLAGAAPAEHEPGVPGGGLVGRALMRAAVSDEGLIKELPRRRRQRREELRQAPLARETPHIGVQGPPGERWPRRRWQVRVGGHAGKNPPAGAWSGSILMVWIVRARSWTLACGSRLASASRMARARASSARRRSVRLSRPPPASAACSAAASSGAKAAGGSSPSWTSWRSRCAVLRWHSRISARSSVLPPAWHSRIAALRFLRGIGLRCSASGGHVQPSVRFQYPMVGAGTPYGRADLLVGHGGSLAEQSGLRLRLVGMSLRHRVVPSRGARRAGGRGA